MSTQTRICCLALIWLCLGVFAQAQILDVNLGGKKDKNREEYTPLEEQEEPGWWAAYYERAVTEFGLAKEAAEAKARELWQSDAIREIRSRYNDAVEQGKAVPGDIQNWVKQDLARRGTWEYYTESLNIRKDLELRERLNLLGEQGWELVDAKPYNSAFYLFIFKRPAKSVLEQVPLRDVLRLLPLLGTGSDAE